uniref:Novel KRAB box and zinc finger, C2H2 type domain containing protein n=1 Tax=Mus musculus TaxID=10090 RepID=A2BE21_MOUSE|nr:novel KRAB box and zinc finger, C2H2 type domain containing protein [Mus musculus]
MRDSTGCCERRLVKLRTPNMVTVGKNIQLKTISKLLEVLEAFAGRSDLQRQKIIQKRKSMKASNVIKSLQQALISMYINEHIPERNLLNVTNMVKLFQKPIVFTYIKEYILERNALTLTNVVKLFQKAVINKIIKQHV